VTVGGAGVAGAQAVSRNTRVRRESNLFFI